MGIRLGILGITGKMGACVRQKAQEDPHFSYIEGVNSKTLTPLSEFISKVDVIIDFSSREGTLALLSVAQEHQTPLVIGTTGLDELTIKQMHTTSLHTPIVHAANFSIGMAASLDAVSLISKKLSQQFTTKIIETHHIHKKDRPSGTALALSEALLAKPEIISIREGETIGTHQIIFTSPSEQITLFHEAFSRETFALGALFAAKRLLHKPAKLYSFKELL